MRHALLFASLLLAPAVSFADSGDVVTDAVPAEESTAIPEGTGLIIIEQASAGGVLGSWLLSLPDHTQRNGSSTSETLSDIPSGNYILYANLPSGAVSTIRIYKNGVLDKSFDRQQTPFSLYPNEVLRISINYRLEKTGTVSVQSDPPGTNFVLTGPDGMVRTGTTPAAYAGIPQGQYKLQYDAFGEGCGKPAPKADQLVEDGRVTFAVTFSCDAATKARERANKDTTKYLTINADGQEVMLQDVLQKDWYATFVFDAAKRGILSGYRDETGAPTGTFGPGNNVTVSELLKIAHRMAGISEEPFLHSPPKNGSGAGYWFSPFLASAENRAWIIYADGTIDPVRPATRAEVVVTLMQAFDVGLRWQKGNVFADVPVAHPYAAAIETAASEGIVSGRTDDAGAATGLFDPEAPITRAEIAKIITTMLAKHKAPATLRNAANRQP